MIYYRHIIIVPFELWNIGINTPNDASDDVRMVPLIDEMDDTFNLGLQPKFGILLIIQLSGGLNDPYTDWIYWAHALEITTPGQAGYH